MNKFFFIYSGEVKENLGNNVNNSIFFYFILKIKILKHSKTLFQVGELR